VSLALGLAGAWTLAGSWREGFAVVLIAAVVCLDTLWGMAMMPGEPFGAVGVLQVTALALFLALIGGRRALAWWRDGDPPDMALRRVLENAGGASFAVAGAVVACLPAAVERPGAVVLVAGVLLAGVGGIFLAPVVMAGLETLKPRRMSLEERYGRRKKTPAAN
jgi:hypothetical protein